jgi:hypothetical protein
VYSKNQHCGLGVGEFYSQEGWKAPRIASQLSRSVVFALGNGHERS